MIHVFIGTKAQLIKMAPIMRELQARGIEYNFIFSGQHQDTIAELRENFGLKEPDIILHRGRDIVSIPKMFFWLIKIVVFSLVNKKKIWRGDKHGIVLNHGDTFSTLAGSALARLAGHTNAHVESGLRSFNYLNPFPEELTRVAVFNLTNIYFCPSEWAAGNLKKYAGKKVITNGNTLYDSLFSILGLDAPPELAIPSDKYCIVSFHRFENIFDGDQLARIVDVLEEVGQKIPVLIIMHKPTLKKLKNLGLFERLIRNANIQLRPRYDYRNFISLVKSSEFIITDGGSNQEECFYLGKPCLLLRKATERKEGLGRNVVLSNFDHSVILKFADEYIKYKCSPIEITPSPSTVIVDYLESIERIDVV